jgi:phosphate ABC transporter phosphate-binding protein
MNFSKKGISTIVLAILLLSTTTATAAAASATTATTTATPATTYYPLTIQAGGSTFVNPLMQTWVSSFNSLSGASFNYAATGSGTAITDIETNIYAFGASDAPVTAAALASATCNPNPCSLDGPLLQIPESLGGVALFYNIPGVTTSLKLTGPIIADIYVGKITSWADPAIAALNPGVIPASDCTSANPTKCTIIPVHRSDGSGTTYALSNYLSKVSADWNASYATYQGSACSAATPCYGTNLGTFWNANPNAQGAAKSSGVAAYVEANNYSLGYADSFYAFNNGLQAASIENQAGVFLAPSLSSIAAAANAFSAQVLANPTFTITNAPGAGSYPISTFTYILIWANQGSVLTGSNTPTQQQQQGFDVAHFLWWIVNQGQADSAGLWYAPLPAALVSVDEGLIQQMNWNGAAFIDATSTTTVSCTLVSVASGSTTTCKATVANSGSPAGFGFTPTGSVTWSQSGTGSVSFAPTLCTLSSGSCSVTMKGFKPGSVTVKAAYSGDNYNQGSSGTAKETVTKASTKTAITCVKPKFTIGTKVTCTATVTGTAPLHTGTITWSKAAGKGSVVFSSGTCKLVAGRCSVTVKGTIAGSITIKAAYGGDTFNLKSFGTLVRTVSFPS